MSTAPSAKPTTRLFNAPLYIRAAPWLTHDTFEDLQLCMRYSLMLANERYSMETQATDWFGVLLSTLEAIHFTLFEHTHKSITYDASTAALQDVYEGFLPPPRSQGPWFKAIEERLEKTSDPYAIDVRKVSSFLSVELDTEDGATPVAILFHVRCMTDPEQPLKKLTLVFNHLGARFNPDAFASVRPMLEATHREKFLEALRGDLEL